MLYAACFRNVNLGQPKSPTRLQLEDAFLQAGASSATSFQVNGTLVFPAPAEDDARQILQSAVKIVQTVSASQEPAFLCPVPHLAELVAAHPFGGIDLSDVHWLNVTFLSPASLLRLSLPLVSPKRDLEVVRLTPYVVLSVSRQVGKGIGYPTPFLEKLLDAPVTTRGWPTIERLVKKFGSGEKTQ